MASYPVLSCPVQCCSAPCQHTNEKWVHRPTRAPGPPRNMCTLIPVSCVLALSWRVLGGIFAKINADRFAALGNPDKSISASVVTSPTCGDKPSGNPM